jgi:hypothetical protein
LDSTRTIFYRAALVGICGLGTTTAAAQSPVPSSIQNTQESPANIHRQLQSGNPPTVAWGAFLAAQNGLVEAIPDLLAVLQVPPVADRFQQAALESAVLDSAVQLNARLPSAVLKQYARRWPVQSLILFANATGDRDGALLDLLRTTTGLEWHGVANLLLETKPVGFSEAMLADLRLRLSITVADRDRVGCASGAGPSIGDGIGVNPAGYPPHAQYRLETGLRPETILLSTGPHPVYYTRTVTDLPQFGVSEIGILTERFDYLMALLPPAVRAVVPLKAQEYGAVRWLGPDDLKRRVSARRDELNRQYQEFLSMLVSVHQLAQAETLLLPSPAIDVTLCDARIDKSLSLPVVTSNP